jgi:DivIVA domain-containing protein
MDSSPTAASILDTLRTVEFRLGLKGYNVDEVDEYLDRAAQEAEALQETVRQLNERLRQAGDRIGQLEMEKRSTPAPEEVTAAAPVAAAPATAPAPVPAPATATLDLVPSDETLQRTLILAQKFVDQIKRESEAEAAARVAEAEETARATVAAAETAALNLQNESQRQLREDVARLESTRTELATDVESMARHLEAERNRLRDALTDILSWVDENVQPTNALMGMRNKAPTKPASAAALAPGADQSAVTSAPPAPTGAGSEVEVDGQPTLNLQAVSSEAETGAPHPA